MEQGKKIAPTFLEKGGDIQSLLTHSYGLVEEAKDSLLEKVDYIC